MQCPVCEAENLDDAVECAGCGRTLAAGPGAGEDGGSLEGLETTHFAPVDPGRIEFLPGVEPTQLEADPQAPSEWTDRLTGLIPRSWRVADILAEFPVALLGA